jgi:hypothetical protein
VWQSAVDQLQTDGQPAATVAALRAALDVMPLWELVGTLLPPCPGCVHHVGDRGRGRAALEQAVRSAKSFLIGLALVKRAVGVVAACDGPG